jgi:hypothetical protein
MAGPSKSYFRKTHADQIADTYTTTHPDWGTPMTVVPQFLYNPGDATMDSNGLCTANTGNVEYFSQEGSGGAMSTGGSLANPDGYVGGTCDGGQKGGGPEHNMGGAQMNSGGGHSNPDGSITPGGYHDCTP